MGNYIEVNDTLQITEQQGFPVDVFDLENHLKTPVTLEDVRGRVFRRSASKKLPETDEGENWKFAQTYGSAVSRPWLANIQQTFAAEVTSGT